VERSSTPERKKKPEHTSNMQEELVTPPVAVVTLSISPKPAEAFCMCSDEEKEKAHRSPYKGPPGSHWCWLCFKKNDLAKCNKIWGNSVLKWDRYHIAEIWTGHNKGNHHKGKKRITLELQGPPKDSPCEKKQKRDGHDDLPPLPAPVVAPAKAKAMCMLHDLVNVLKEINEENVEERAVVLKTLQKRQIKEGRALQLLASPRVVAGRGLQTELKKRMRFARRLGSKWPKNHEDWNEEDLRSFNLVNALQLDPGATKICFRGPTFELLPGVMSKGEHSDLLIALDLRVGECERDA
jgi:hypothetical protein